MSTEPYRFRPVFGRILTVAVAIVCAAGIVGFIVTGDWVGLVQSIWPLLLFVALAWALFWVPELIVEDHEITVVNVLRTFRIQWPALQHIDTRYSLTLFTSGGKISVWAAPAPGFRGATRIDQRDVKNLSDSAYMSGTVRPGDALGTPSGQAAQVVRIRWDELREAGYLESGAVPPDAVRARWNVIPIAVVGALVLATVVSVLL